VLELGEVLRYGMDSYGDANYVSIYGLPPAVWYARGIRLLGRTAVECTRDELAVAIGHDVANAASSAPGDLLTSPSVIDPFGGSGNTLYWMLHHLPGAHGLGFEADPQVFQLTHQNLSILGVPFEFRQADHVTALHELTVPRDQLLIAFLAPPWGTALSQSEGLDLRATSPPLREIVDLFAESFPNPMLFAIQVFEQIVPASLTELTSRCDWSTLRIYNFNAPGQNHGLLLMARGWRPGSSSR